MRRTGSRRRAFTLVELLVVLAVIGLLAALLMPAVQQARAAARHNSCLNNLKQIGVALHNYYDANQVFPPGWMAAQVPGADYNNYFAWSALLLPYLEQGELATALDFDVDIDEGENPQFVQTRLSSFRCPSDTAEPTCVSATTGVEFGISNYPGCGGCLLCGIFGEGLFILNHSRRARDISDGLSTTFAVGERLGKQAPDEVPVWAGVYDTNNIGMNFWVVLGWTQIPINDTTLPDHCFSSPHEGGANFLLCDGSARFVSENINSGTLTDTGIYQNLGTIADNVPIGEY